MLCSCCSRCRVSRMSPGPAACHPGNFFCTVFIQPRPFSPTLPPSLPELSAQGPKVKPSRETEGTGSIPYPSLQSPPAAAFLLLRRCPTAASSSSRQSRAVRSCGIAGTGRLCGSCPRCPAKALSDSPIKAQKAPYCPINVKYYCSAGSGVGLLIYLFFQKKPDRETILQAD